MGLSPLPNISNLRARSSACDVGRFSGMQHSAESVWGFITSPGIGDNGDNKYLDAIAYYNVKKVILDMRSPVIALQSSTHVPNQAFEGL